MEPLFRRLEVYTEVQPTTEMKDMIVKIIVEVFSILAIATMEINQSRMSGFLLLYITNTLPLTELCSETYLKRLIGSADIEDALKRLDRLTQEEARMATTQMKATHSIDDRVAGVDGRVKSIDGKVARIIDSTPTISSQSPKDV
jgi:hypothetical protein